MNYHIHINQLQAVKLGLTLQEAAIVDGLASMFNSTKTKEHIYKGKSYKWVAASKLLDDLPILDIKKRRCQELIKSLEQKQVIERCPENQQLGMSYYRGGKNWDILFSNSAQLSATPMQNNAEGGMQNNAEGGMQNNADYPNTNNPNTNNPIKKETKKISKNQTPPEPIGMLQDFLDAYGSRLGMVKTQNQWKFLSTLEKEKALIGAKVWRKYYDAEGTTGTKYQTAPYNFLNNRLYLEQPPKTMKQAAAQTQKSAGSYKPSPKYA